MNQEQRDKLVEALLTLVREVAENKMDEYKDSISDGVSCGSPTEWPSDREQRFAEEVVDILANATSEGSPPSQHENKQERNGDSLH